VFARSRLIPHVAATFLPYFIRRVYRFLDEKRMSVRYLKSYVWVSPERLYRNSEQRSLAEDEHCTAEGGYATNQFRRHHA